MGFMHAIYSIYVCFLALDAFPSPLRFFPVHHVVWYSGSKIPLPVTDMDWTWIGNEGEQPLDILA